MKDSTVNNSLWQMAFVGLVALTGSVSHASILSGDSVDVRLIASPPASPINILQAALAVGPGADGNFFNNQLFNLDAGPSNDIFSVTSTSTFTSINGVGGTVEWVLSDLDFTGGTTLVGINFIQSFSNVIVSSLGPNNVTFQYTDIGIPSGTYFQAQFVTSTPSGGAIPEPTMFLIWAGLACCGTLVQQRVRRP